LCGNGWIGDTITVRLDEDAARALAPLTGWSSNVMSAIAPQLIVKPPLTLTVWPVM
jgi:hypothetical protein